MGLVTRFLFLLCALADRLFKDKFDIPFQASNRFIVIQIIKHKTTGLQATA